MKALLGLAGGVAVLAMGGVESISSGVASLAVLAAMGCWVMSGWIID